MAQQTLPIWTWVCIKKGLYKGDIGFVKTSDQTDVTLIVSPCECPYDLPQQSGEKSLFSSELVTLASLALESIVSPVGEDGAPILCPVLARIQYSQNLQGGTFCTEAQEGDLDDKDEAIHCCIWELCRVFSTGQMVRIIAGPYHSYVGHIIMASGGSVSLQYNGQSPHLEVSELLLEMHVPDHVHSLSTKHDAGMCMNLPEPADKVLPSDTTIVC
ncbi:hypothetical protein F5141DRAFT_1212448 [Pisolithus sp. B1]|nr:hypothetical protein F5141DRAFT_1212448 [Pisolithus sp. B1]